MSRLFSVYLWVLLCFTGFPQCLFWFGWAELELELLRQIDRQMDDSCYHENTGCLTLLPCLSLPIFIYLFISTILLLLSLTHKHACSQRKANVQIYRHILFDENTHRHKTADREAFSDFCLFLFFFHIHFCFQLLSTPMKKNTFACCVCVWKRERGQVEVCVHEHLSYFLSPLLSGLWCSLPTGPGSIVGRTMRSHRDWRNCPCWYSHTTTVSHKHTHITIL